MRYTFDETGSVIGFSTHYPEFVAGYWEDYLFAKNLQGDVVAMYLITVEPPRLIATYEYDEWGKVTAVRDATGAILTDPAHLANRNPFRYRGYHYDIETGFYYLQSRYYDPAISRFINADSYGSTGQAFLGTNMFAYCLNNPIFLHDTSGDTAVTVAVTNYWNPVGWLFAGVILVGAAVAAGEFIADSISHTSSTASPPPPNNNDKDKNQNYNYNGAKSKSYVNKRGWTDDMIQSAINNGPQGTSVNMANQNSCTVYRYPGVDNQYVVIDDVTQSIVQVSNFTDPGWIPDSRIIWIP